MIPEGKRSFRCVSCFAVGCFVLRPISCYPCDLYVYVIVCRSRRVCVLRMKRVPVPNRTFIGSQLRRISVSCASLSTLWIRWINPLLLYPLIELSTPPFPFYYPNLRWQCFIWCHCSLLMPIDAFVSISLQQLSIFPLCFIAFPTIIRTHIMRSLHSCLSYFTSAVVSSPSSSHPLSVLLSVLQLNSLKGIWTHSTFSSPHFENTLKTL